MPTDKDREDFDRELASPSEDEIRTRFRDQVYRDSDRHWQYRHVRHLLEGLEREREEAHRRAQLQQGSEALVLAREANDIANGANRHAGRANWIALAAAATAAVALLSSCGIL